MCGRAAYLKKTKTKKAPTEYNLSIEDIAKVMAYCLFINFYLSFKEINVPNNYATICKLLSGIV